MLSRSSDWFFVSDLKAADPEGYNWFTEDTPVALAGRCLVDALEYLRADPKFPARFRIVTNAHAIRLVCRCLGDETLDRRAVLERLKPRVLEMFRQLREARNDSAPHYGDDFWDWAAVLEAFVEVRHQFPDSVSNSAVTQELNAYRDSVRASLPTGLTMDNPAEWYGPAAATVAHRLLATHRTDFADGVDDLLEPLREQALESIAADGSYGGRPGVVQLPHHKFWHYGQVVAEFGNQGAATQAAEIGNLSWLKTSVETADRVYALSRVIQGARKVNDQTTIATALKELYRNEDANRPLGQGLLGGTIKGSLNALEALWPLLPSKKLLSVRSMIDALLKLHVEANTVGIVVAIPHEADVTKKAFGDRARMTRTEGLNTIIEHDKYRVVMCPGKSLMDANTAALTLIDKYHARWLILVGVAGSLGVIASNGKGGFKGPDIGALVIATSVAPFQIRDKYRTEIENAKVPLLGNTWMTVPVDPLLFKLAHEVSERELGDRGFYEGLVVTGTGIKDALKAKNEILAEFPGGLAVEEEGYVVAIQCLVNRVPCLILRGISDRAQGDKKKQSKNAVKETAAQVPAAAAAARVAVGVVERLSEEW